MTTGLADRSCYQLEKSKFIRTGVWAPVCSHMRERGNFHRLRNPWRSFQVVRVRTFIFPAQYGDKPLILHIWDFHDIR